MNLLLTSLSHLNPFALFGTNAEKCDSESLFLSGDILPKQRGAKMTRISANGRKPFANLNLQSSKSMRLWKYIGRCISYFVDNYGQHVTCKLWLMT